jgi:hypothetical protein
MRRRYWIMSAVLVLAVVAAGSAVAATKLASPRDQSKAIISDAAGRLHVSPSALSSALRQALEDQIDRAVQAGRLTKQQGDALKAQIAKGRMPLVGGPASGFGFGFGGPGHGFDFQRHLGMMGPGPGGMFRAGLAATASYLGITQAQLRSELGSGKSLAQIAKAHGKTADGLVAALVAVTKSRLDKAVAGKHLTSAQEKAIVARLHALLEGLVNGTPHGWSEGMLHHGFGFGHRFGPPSAGTHRMRPQAAPPAAQF